MNVVKKLPGLNGLRAIAASIVLIGHVFQILSLSGYKRVQPFFEFLSPSLKEMVNLFFVISGYIITYLLCMEKEKKNTIDLILFYKKRALRIWPLYFFIFIIVYIISNNTGIYQIGPPLNKQSILVFGLFVVNLNSWFTIPLSVIPHYWSLSVEEQFYLFWPAIFKKVEGISLCISIILIIILCRNITSYLSHHNNGLQWKILNEYFVQSSFSSMAIGGLAGILLHKSKLKAISDYLSSNILWVVLWEVFIAQIIFKINIPYIGTELHALFYVIIILAAIGRKRSFLDLGVFDKLGTVSFGLYMYHWPLIPILIYAANFFGLQQFISFFYSIPFVIFCFFATYLVSFLSYKYLEFPFLKMKDRLTN